MRTRSARRPNRVALYTDAAERGGAEAALRSVAEHLGPQLDVVVMGPAPEVLAWIAAARPGARTRVTPRVQVSRELTRAGELRSALVEEGASVLLLNKNEVGGLRYVDLVARTIRGLRVCSTVHNVEPPGTAPARFLSRALARLPGPTIAVGTQVAQQLESILGVRPGSVDVIPNALSPTGPRGRPPEGPFTIGTLARLVPGKRIDLLLRALTALPAAELIIGGDGPERADLGRLAARLGISDRVSFLGWVDPCVVLDVCDVFALSSDHEGWPMSVIEAQHRGVPVVATSVGSVPEMIADGHSGLLVPRGDVEALTAALATLQADPLRAHEMGERAQAAIVRDCTPTAMARSYEALLGFEPTSAMARP